MIGLGGTIAMTGSPARPARSAEELVAAAPGLGEIAAVGVQQLANVPGAHLSPADLARAVAAAAAAVDEGAAGAVILQGTDTIEETADLAALVWDREAPLAVTGAMRPGGAASADGPANLLDAVVLAASPDARGAGAVVVFDGLVHDGAEAIKAHTWRTGAFWSPAPLGEVREGMAHLQPAPRGAPVATPAEAAAAALDAYVPVVTAAAGMDSRPLDALREQGAVAVVLLALGAGHVPAGMLAGVDRALAAGLPVAVCARPPFGGTLERTYGFEGSETDLADRGALLAGRASPWKARIRLLLALGLALDPATVLVGRPPPPPPPET
ncbi:MAG: asparaginase domain-containing protein [Thermoleophilaceae bacterium]